ncbi:hypothetical protein Lser_V15G30967 [Lactuca serriola]
MAERKVLNKYYPADFDPAKIPRRRIPINQQINVRMMLPMSIQCKNCGNYMSRGTKFNSRKEEVKGETYLGMKIFRLYFKCSKCSAEITIKTDPQNSDYFVESGAHRNFEPIEKKQQCTKSLENKRQMEILSGLEEMKSLKSRHASVSVDAMLEALQQRSTPMVQQEEKLEEEVIKSIFQKRRKVSQHVSDHSPTFQYFKKSKTKTKTVSDSRVDVPKSLTMKLLCFWNKQSEADYDQGTSNGLQVLCQHYDNGQEEEEKE